MNRSNNPSRRRNANRKQFTASNNVRLSHVVHQVNKIEPFLVRKNAQIMSVPSHKETGLNIERVFRLIITSSGTAPSPVTEADVAAGILSELGIATTTSPLDITIKDARLYANRSVTASFLYRTGNQASRVMVASDYVNQAGISSIHAVYPVASRVSFTSDTTSTDPVFTVRIDGGVTQAFLIIDVLARVSSRGVAFEP